MGEVGGGMRNEIFGTLILVGLGSLFALPVGLLAGIFLSEYASPKVAATVRFMADILAGVPSIVVGVFVYAIMVRPMHSYSALSGGVALAIIMIPVVARTAEESLRLVPNYNARGGIGFGYHPLAGGNWSNYTRRDDRDYYRNHVGVLPVLRGKLPRFSLLLSEVNLACKDSSNRLGHYRCKYIIMHYPLINQSNNKPGQELFFW